MCFHLKFSEAYFLIKDANILYVQAALSHEAQGSLPGEYEFGWASVLVWMFWRREKFLGSVRNQTTVLWLSSP
jgi:hypothetical protein